MSLALKEKLAERGLRKTAFRMELLALFSQTRSSLSILDIKNKVGETSDKVTIYRALDAFEKNGLIHRVPDRMNLARYALCHNDCKPEVHTHNHAHFICTLCEETYCIDSVELPEVNVDPKFIVNTMTLTLEGECANCQPV